MGKSSNKKGKNTDDEIDAAQKPKLQAVLLADPFLSPQQGKSFKPLTLDGPKMLCPLNNVKLIEHSLDFLATQGVEQVFVVCTHDKMEEYLVETKKTTKGHFAMEIIPIKDTSLTNAGDALRELYKRNVVQSDPFILLYGDCITNMDLRGGSGGIVGGVMQAHQERRSKDSSSIMTIVLKEKSPSSPTAVGAEPAMDDLIVGLDSDTNRVLLYDNESSNKAVKVPCSFFKVHSTIEVRDDLLETGVCICSPDVLGRFEDEFDYLHISQDFVHNSVAEEEEGLQTRIHAHILPTSTYAARVLDEATYHRVSHDLLRRWCHPVVPDNYHHPRSDDDSSMYAQPQRQYKVVSQVAHPPQLYHYKEITHPSKVGRTSTITGPGMLGCGGSIAEGATVLVSAVGNYVYVHEGATVQSSHLWDNVEVGANATVIESIVAQDCVIGEGALVNKGCVLGKGVVVGKGMTIPEFTRITLQMDDEDDEFGDDGDWGDDSEDDDGDDDEEESATDNALGSGGPRADDSPETDFDVVGKDGTGHVWVYTNDENDDSDDEDDLVVTVMEKMKMQSIGYDPSPYWSKREAYQAEDEDDELSRAGGPTEDEEMDARAFSMMTDDAFTFEDTPTASSSAAPVVFGRQKGVDVVKEMKEICLEFEETSPMENLAIELNSYKFSQNATYSDCTRASTLAMVDRLKITADMKDGKLVSSLKGRLAFWGPLLQKMSIGIDEEKSILYGLEQVAIQENSPVAAKLSSGLSFRFVLQTLHDEEVLSEEAILAWAAERKEEPENNPKGKLFQLRSIQDFLEWLEEESDEDGSDDESDSGDDDDSALHSA